MSGVAVLASLKWAELRNRITQFRRRARFKTLVIATFSVAFWISLYQIFFHALRLLKQGVGFQAQTENVISSMFHVFFFALTLMLIFSNAIIGYTAYFRSRETGFLFSLPLRMETIFLYKFAESLAFSSWAFLFLGTPLMAAYADVFDLGFGFFLLTIPYFAAFLFVPAALGALVALVVTVYLPRTRRSLIVTLVAAVMLMLLLLLSKLLALRSGYLIHFHLAREVLDSVEFSRNPLLPSSWVARGILLLGSGSSGSAAFYFAVIAANGLFLCSIAYTVSSGLLQRGWFLSQSTRKVKSFPVRGVWDFLCGKGLFFLSRAVRLIVCKDVKSFLRDPVQWTQFLIFFGMLGIYFLNLRSFSYEEKNLMWKTLISQMNLLATSLTLATFASRFIYPQLSLEGRRFWVIGMMPIDRDQILYGKLALSFTSSLLISEILIAVSSFMLKTPLSWALLHGVALFGICLGISGLAVGLGAVYPNFAEDNPSKIVAGFGGTLNLVLCLFFVLIVLALQAVPCFLYYSGSIRWDISPATFRLVLAGAMAAIAVVSLAVCLIPMSMGLRAIRRLEV